MTNLLYWSGDRLNSASTSRSESPFWNSLQETIGESQKVLISYPYLAPSYIEEISNEVDEWQLVTDIQAWTHVYSGKKEHRIREFVHTHEENIRHYPGLHAKVVVGDESAMLGSANLTRNGMVERQEVGIHLTDTEQVAELREWFNDTWTTGTRVTEGVLPAATDECGTTQNEQSSTDLDRFDRLAKAPSREWAEALLNTMEIAIREANLGDADPRLVTSAAQDDRLVVIVNSRYVCGGFFDGAPRVGFILADEFDGVDEMVQQSVAGEYYQFSTRDGRDPHWVEFDRHPDTALPKQLRPAWIDAIEHEVERGTRSQYREYHDSHLYRLIVDEQYRDAVLEQVFD